MADRHYTENVHQQNLGGYKLTFRIFILIVKLFINNNQNIIYRIYNCFFILSGTSDNVAPHLLWSTPNELFGVIGQELRIKCIFGGKYVVF